MCFDGEKVNWVKCLEVTMSKNCPSLLYFKTGFEYLFPQYTQGGGLEVALTDWSRSSILCDSGNAL